MIHIHVIADPINNTSDYEEKLLEYIWKLFVDQLKCIVLHIIIGNNCFRLKQYDDNIGRIYRKIIDIDLKDIIYEEKANVIDEFCREKSELVGNEILSKHNSNQLFITLHRLLLRDAQNHYHQDR